MEEGRVLVEDGPVHTALKRAIAILFACIVGLVVGDGYVGYTALRATQRITDSRVQVTREACEKQNARHEAAVPALKALVPGGPAQAEALKVVNALAPKEDCARRVARVR